MRRHPRRAIVDPTAPRAWATDDRTGFIGNHKDLKWQHDWRGNQLVNLRILTYEPDNPQRQLGTIIIPPDPPPIYNARPEGYPVDENPVSTRYTMDGNVRIIISSLPPYRQRIVVGGAADTPHTP